MSYELFIYSDKYPRPHLMFWGGISTQCVLAHGTPEQVKKETAEICACFGKGGGYIVAPTHSVPGDVPERNVDALIEVILNQDKYL